MNPPARSPSAPARVAGATAAGATLCALAAGLAHAQVATTGPPSPIDRYAVDVWTTDDGLPQNSINAIAQTPDGYLWIGTSGGIARFDGMRFTTLERRDSTGSYLDRVVAFSVGPDGALWIATEDGLLRYHEGRFASWRTADGVPGMLVSAVHADPDGSVWINADGTLARFADGVFTRIAPPGFAWGISRDADGVLWYAPSPRGGLLAADTVPVPTGASFFLVQDGDDRWFAVPGGGLLRLDDGRRWEGSDLGPGDVVALRRDGAGDLWIASREGLKLFLPETDALHAWTIPLPGRGVTYEVRTLFVDAEGTLWAGTNGHGLVRVMRRRFRVYAGPDGLGKEQMTAVMEDASGRMLLATNCGGLYELPPGSQTVRRFAWPGGEPGPDCPVSLAQSADGALWVGAGPLYRIHDGVSSIVRTPDGADVWNVHALHEGRDGTMWAGLLDGGVVALRPDGSARRYGRADGMGHDRILFVTEDGDGVVWAGGPGGLGRLEDGRFTWYTAADGLPIDYVRAVHRDDEGVHWIGTYGGGIVRLKDGRFRAIGERDGLADDVVSSILEDDEGNLWLTGNRGIQRARRADLAAFADGTLSRVHSVLYDRRDGLLSVETNGGFHPAAWRARDGSLWFPTIRGVAVIDSAGASFGGAPPRAAVEEILVDDAPVTDGAGVEIGPGRDGLEVRYTGLSFIAPEHMVFRYRLVGFDRGWAAVGTLRQAYYPRLPPGRYRFEVQAANRDGVWGAMATVPVRVLPWVWETLWFRLLAVFGGVGAAVGAVRHRFVLLRREHERQRAFAWRFIEGQETERKRIAAELHDSIGQGLLVAKNRASLVLRSAGIGGEARRHLEEIASVMAETLETAREISHNLRPHELDRLGLAVAVRTAVEQASAAGTRVFADVDAVDGLLSQEARINLYRIVQEALSNVMKHARATSARVVLRRETASVRLMIVDNGAGFDAGAHAPGFGLSGIAERVALLGGRHEVVSAPGSGTTIVVTIPVAARPPAS